VQIPLLDQDHPRFPDPSGALTEPDGLLAVGGNLQPQTLLSAYRSGIFPWYQDEDPILWWSPATRCVLPPSDLHCSKSLRKTLRRNDYQVTVNQAFNTVIDACSEPREDDGGTWITDEMKAAYTHLHQQGKAHSLEVWFEDNLIGGLYGVAVGSIFCGESMFSRRASASKIAMAHLCRWGLDTGVQLIDCQLVNPHLVSLGAISMDRSVFIEQLSQGRDKHLNWPPPGTDQQSTKLQFNW
jgi:leucyl/phenylalanyl-tRNA--protein transferase